MNTVRPDRTSGLDRRQFIAACALPLIGCAKPDGITGGFAGINHERGHLLPQRQSWPAPAVTYKTDVLIAGGGVAGLAAARGLRLKGMEDFALLELEDSAGGNGRGGAVGGIACPLGAHYLPLPSDDAPEVQDLLEELGLRRRVAGRWEYDERHLCHSPQERLFFNGEWQDGLLPLQGVGATTLAQYQRFSDLVRQAQQQARWTIPTSKSPVASVQRTLVAITFIVYLEQNGLDDAHLRWYLDYCCRDDYGAGIATVSAWAGIHYFASRHGFHAPGRESADREALLTWPDGNAWLARRLAAPLGERLHTGRVVVRIASGKHGVEVDAFNIASQQIERWLAQRAIVALPIFVAARVLEGPPDFLRQAAQRIAYAPWLVANIHIKAALHDRPGPAPSWDNVLYGDAVSAPGLGYVDAMHQSLQSVPGATVLSYYRALGGLAGHSVSGAGALAPGVAGRRLLLDKPWAAWRDDILRELSLAHPDLVAKVTCIDITRYGHGMAIPVPNKSGLISLEPASDDHGQLRKQEPHQIRHERLTFAHSDWAGYSVFEEAFTMGHWAA